MDSGIKRILCEVHCLPSRAAHILEVDKAQAVGLERMRYTLLSFPRRSTPTIGCVFVATNFSIPLY
jgi:hypothetical protein